MLKKGKKTGLFVILVTVSVVAFTACNKKNKKMETGAIENDSTVLIEELPEVKDYTIYSFEQKAFVISDAKNELAKIGQKIDTLKAEINNEQNVMSETQKAAREATIKEMEKVRDDFNSRIKEVEKSTADTWETIKADITNAHDSTFKNLRQIYNKVVNITDKVEKIAAEGSDSLKGKVK